MTARTDAENVDTWELRKDRPYDEREPACGLISIYGSRIVSWHRPFAEAATREVLALHDQHREAS